MEPLTAEDRAILALERPGLVGHTCKVVRLAGSAPTPAERRAAVGLRLPEAPRLTWRLAGPADAPAWEPAAVDLDAHVVGAPARAPLTGEELRAAVERLFVQPLDRRRPLWRMDLVGPLADGGAALVWRIHHALADGTTALRLAQQVLWDPRPAGDGVDPPHHPPGRPAERADDALRRQLARLVRDELAPGLRRSPFDRRIGDARTAAWAVVPLAGVREAARALAGATVNDAVLAVVAGGLRRWLLARHGPVHDLRVKVPVSLHTDGDAAGNHDSFFRVGLPLGEPDPVARLAAVRTQTAQRKQHHDAEDLAGLKNRLARTSPRLAAWSARLQRSGRTFALNVSNVRGPAAEVSVLGAQVAAIHPLVEVAPHHALRVAVVSLADRLCFGFVADPAAVGDLDLLAASVEAEAGDLVAAGLA
ncbi:wax ester/triacylglycerol synthase domain-containing protein [Trujillonella humicola]|uniref:wax ester/triacylglycerol synthase domain-containing protein n=1 Tax=Trujillonella humicola TaxID=3383699 RepID=UPI003906615D